MEKLDQICPQQMTVTPTATLIRHHRFNPRPVIAVVLNVLHHEFSFSSVLEH
jgi:hypothetical protein